MTGFMIILDRLWQVGVALLVPIVIGEIGFRALQWFGPLHFWRVPALTLPAKLLGLVVATIVLASQYDARLFDLHLLFTPQSPWNLSVWSFLAERVNPFSYDVNLMLRPDTAGGASGFIASGQTAVIVLVLWLAGASLFFFWRPFDAPRAFANALLSALLVGYLLIYLVCFAAWTLYLLNFWSLAVLIVAFQYYRHRA